MVASVGQRRVGVDAVPLICWLSLLVKPSIGVGVGAAAAAGGTGAPVVSFGTSFSLFGLQLGGMVYFAMLRA